MKRYTSNISSLFFIFFEHLISPTAEKKASHPRCCFGPSWQVVLGRSMAWPHLQTAFHEGNRCSLKRPIFRLIKAPGRPARAVNPEFRVIDKRLF